jgi:hypothetical protein
MKASALAELIRTRIVSGQLSPDEELFCLKASDALAPKIVDTYAKGIEDIKGEGHPLVVKAERLAAGMRRSETHSVPTISESFL